MAMFSKLNEYISTADGTDGTLLIPKLIMPTLIEEVDKRLIPREMAAMVFGPSSIKGSTFMDLITLLPNEIPIKSMK